jgi:hypothetical protein
VTIERVDLRGIVFDELVADDVHVHIERMSNSHIWMAVESAGKRIVLNFSVHKRSLNVTIANEPLAYSEKETSVDDIPEDPPWVGKIAHRGSVVSAHINEGVIVECDDCEGTGRIEWAYHANSPEPDGSRECSACNGTAEVLREPVEAGLRCNHGLDRRIEGCPDCDDEESN